MNKSGHGDAICIVLNAINQFIALCYWGSVSLTHLSRKKHDHRTLTIYPRISSVSCHLIVALLYQLYYIQMYHVQYFGKTYELEF